LRFDAIFGSLDCDYTLLSLSTLFFASYNLSTLFLLIWFKQFILMVPMAMAWANRHLFVSKGF
jgi:hypothetical protein